MYRLEEDSITVEKLQKNVSMLQDKLSTEKVNLTGAVPNQTVRIIIFIKR